MLKPSYHLMVKSKSKRAKRLRPMEGKPAFFSRLSVLLLMRKVAHNSFPVSMGIGENLHSNDDSYSTISATQPPRADECAWIGKNTEFGVEDDFQGGGPLTP